MIIGIACKRAFEPGECGDQAVAPSDNLALKRQRRGLIRQQRDRTRRSIRGGTDIAHSQRHATERGPVAPVARLLCNQAAKINAGCSAVAEQYQRGGADAASIGGLARCGAVSRLDRTDRVILEQPSLRLERVERGDRDAGIPRAGQFGLGRESVA